MPRPKIKSPKPPQAPTEKSSESPAASSPKSRSFTSPLDNKNGVAFVSGRRGSGKTTLAAKMVKHFKRIVVFDPRAQVTEKFDQLGVKHEIAVTPDEFVRAVEASPEKFVICYVPANDVQAEFLTICRYIKETPFDDTLFFIDEVSMTCDTWNIPADFDHILRFGRHNRIGLMMTAQRPVDVNRDVTAQCNHLFIFQQHEPNDIKYFSGLIGKETDKLANLTDHSFLYADLEKQKIIIVDKNLSVV